MARVIDLRNPLVHFLIALAAAAVGSLVSYVAHGSKDFQITDVLAGLIVAVAIQISFLTYESNMIKRDISRLYPYLDGPSPAQAFSLINLLRSIPGIDNDVLSVTVSDSSKGKVWLDILKIAETLDSIHYLDPSCWLLTSDGRKSLDIQKERISDGELEVRRIFIFRQEDKDDADFRRHIDSEASAGIEVRWIGVEDNVASILIGQIKSRFGFPDISLFKVRGQKLLYCTQMDEKNIETAGSYRLDGYLEAQNLYDELFKRGGELKDLPRPRITPASTGRPASPSAR
ncbi:MAG: hypothetical protein ACJ76N_20475 [Thermoanaerobaculia bacterium]